MLHATWNLCNYSVGEKSLYSIKRKAEQMNKPSMTLKINQDVIC